MKYYGEVSGDRAVKTFAHLSHGSGVIRDRALKKESGYYWDSMASLLLTAFSFEAYLNHLGGRLLPYWEQLDRLPWQKKLQVILTHLKHTPDLGKAPYQTLYGLFLFRNAVAHGRDTKENFGPEIRLIDDETFRAHELIKTEWEKVCTPEWAQKALTDIKEIIEQLHDLAGFEKFDLISSDSASWSIRFVSDEKEPPKN
jgi:hypothetical protein